MSDPQPVRATPSVVNTLDPIGFATVDGWLRHPDTSKSHLWKPAGRLDDVVGTRQYCHPMPQKLNSHYPDGSQQRREDRQHTTTYVLQVLNGCARLTQCSTEVLLCASQYIYQAIVFGTGRFVNGVIVNPPAGLLKCHGEEDVNKYLDLIWPHIKNHVNETVPQHSRLLREMVLIARPDRPFLVSDKGTVKAKATLALYAEDVERAYETLELGIDTSTTIPVHGLPLGAGNPEKLSRDVCAFVETLVADIVGQKLGPKEDFFQHGMDSLGATRLRALLIAAVRRAGIETPVPRNLVYAHPTCVALSRFLITLAAAEPEAKANAGEDLELNIVAMIETYSKGLPHHKGTHPLPTDGDVYAVTGTTGSLGTSFVANLLTQPRVKKVYFLNRNRGAHAMESRQERAFLDKGLNLSLLQEAAGVGRVEFVEFEVGKAHLGIEDQVYSKVRCLTAPLQSAQSNNLKSPS